MFSVSQLHLDRFKQNSQKVMLNNLATAVQNFVRKFWILMELLIVNFLVLNVTVSHVVSEKRKLDDYDYLGRFILRFHALISVSWLRTSS